MKRYSISLAALLLFPIAIPGPAGATAITLSDTRDETLSNGVSADLNFGKTGGTGAGTFVSASGTTSQRGLMGFDVSSLAGKYASITSITLRVFDRQVDGSAPQTVQVYEVASTNANWVEGTGNNGSNGDPVPGASTWNFKHDNTSPTAAWTGGAGLGTPGTGFGATPLSSLVFTGDPGVGTQINFTFTGDLTALMNRWMTEAGGVNASLLLHNTVESGPAASQRVIFESRDNGNAALIPELIVNFVPVPEPSTLSLLGLACIAALICAVRTSTRQISG